MTINLHSWVLPLAITIILFLVGVWRTERVPSGGDYNFGQSLIGFLWLCIWAVGSLSAWLVWALLR